MNDLKFTTAGEYMDSRCCGSDACVIDTEGNCCVGKNGMVNKCAILWSNLLSVLHHDCKI